MTSTRKQLRRQPPALSPHADNDAAIAAAESLFEELINHGGPALVYLGRLHIELPGLEAATLALALCKAWDQYDAAEKVCFLADAVARDRRRLEPNRHTDLLRAGTDDL